MNRLQYAILKYWAWWIAGWPFSSQAMRAATLKVMIDSYKKEAKQ